MNKATEKDLGKLAIARTAQGELIGVGKIIGYVDAPTVTIELPNNGRQISWRADMTEVVAGEDAAQFVVPK